MTYRHSKTWVFRLYVAVENWAGVDVSGLQFSNIHHLQTGLQHLGEQRLGLPSLHHSEDGPGGHLVGDRDHVHGLQAGLGEAGLNVCVSVVQTVVRLRPPAPLLQHRVPLSGRLTE